MKIKNGQITFLVNEDRTVIEFRDADANLLFARALLTPKQLSQALSRMGDVSCDMEVYAIEKIGTKHECLKLEFEIPEGLGWGYKRDESKIYELALQAAPEGWTPDNYFSSQDSFFSKNGKEYARCTIRRWVKNTEE